ncbi:MAG: FtsX-like permease family protein [bacterium]
MLPTRGQGEMIPLRVPGHPSMESENPTPVEVNMVLPGYFESMDIPLLAGRFLSDEDDEDRQLPSVLVNRSMARTYWGEEDPVGRHIVAPGGAKIPVVGVVGDVRQVDPESEPVPTVYISLYQSFRSVVYWTVETRGSPKRLIPEVRNILTRLDPRQPLTEMAAMEEVLHEAMARPRSAAALLVLFAVLAAVLSAEGTYGVLSYTVGQRTRELGIRQALGAGRRRVVGMVVRQGMAMVGIGVAVGLGLALVAGRVLTGILYEISPADPLSLGATVALLAGAGFLACWLPARRAVRVDPVEALRHM